MVLLSFNNIFQLVFLYKRNSVCISDTANKPRVNRRYSILISINSHGGAFILISFRIYAVYFNLNQFTEKIARIETILEFQFDCACLKRV